MMTNKLNELKVNGSVRIYSTEADMKETMEYLEITLDKDLYTWGWEENRSGEFVEILKIEE